MDQLYADALSALEARPHLERMRQLARALPAAVGEQIAALMTEQRQLKTLLESRYPKAVSDVLPADSGSPDQSAELKAVAPPTVG